MTPDGADFAFLFHRFLGLKHGEIPSRCGTHVELIGILRLRRWVRFAPSTASLGMTEEIGCWSTTQNRIKVPAKASP